MVYKNKFPSTKTYLKCVRCGVDKMGKDRDYHWCEKCFLEFDKIKDDKLKRVDFVLKSQIPNKMADFPSDSDDE